MSPLPAVSDYAAPNDLPKLFDSEYCCGSVGSGVYWGGSSPLSSCRHRNKTNIKVTVQELQLKMHLRKQWNKYMAYSNNGTNIYLYGVFKQCNKYIYGVFKQWNSHIYGVFKLQPTFIVLQMTSPSLHPQDISISLLLLFYFFKFISSLARTIVRQVLTEPKLQSM